MAVERRYRLASSVARLIQREGEPATRMVEAHFPARSDRTQFVRVERGRAALILRSSRPDGQVGEEAVEVPLSHAEALLEVASGTVAFDRIALALGGGADAVLDRFILPQGLDLLSVTISGDPRLFAPPLWLGPEVTGEAAFEARELAVNGLPAFLETEVSNAALEALLDNLEGGRLRRSFNPEAQPTQRAEGTATPDGSERSPASTQHASVWDQGDAAGADVTDPERVAGHSSLILDSADQREIGPSLPDVEDGPVLDSPPAVTGRRPILRTNIEEVDDGIARLARSLAPRGPRSTR